MGYSTDFIRRQIELLAAAIAHALSRGDQGPNREAVSALDDALAAGTGLHAALLVRLDPTSVVTLVGTERAGLVADALEARAWISEPDERARSMAAARRLRLRIAREAA